MAAQYAERVGGELAGKPADPIEGFVGWAERAGFGIGEVLERDHYPGVEVETRRAYVRAISSGSAGTSRGCDPP